jgi:hypothetical protein
LSVADDERVVDGFGFRLPEADDERVLGRIERRRRHCFGRSRRAGFVAIACDSDRDERRGDDDTADDGREAQGRSTAASLDADCGHGGLPSGGRGVPAVRKKGVRVTVTSEKRAENYV